MYQEQNSVNDSYTDTRPRPFTQIPELWIKIFQMTEGFFAQEAPRASGTNTLIGVVILAVFSAVFSALTSLISGGMGMATMPDMYEGVEGIDAAAVLASVVVSTACCGLIVTPIGFYVNNGITYLGARIFGGSGDFGGQAYLTSLFTVPLGLVTSVVSLSSAVPTVGGCITAVFALAVSIYGLVLNVRAIKVVHRLSTGRALAVILAPGVMISVALACIVAVVLTLLGPMIGEVFENVITNM